MKKLVKNYVEKLKMIVNSLEITKNSDSANLSLYIKFLNTNGESANPESTDLNLHTQLILVILIVLSFTYRNKSQ